MVRLAVDGEHELALVVEAGSQQQVELRIGHGQVEVLAHLAGARARVGVGLELGVGAGSAHRSGVDVHTQLDELTRHLAEQLEALLTELGELAEQRVQRLPRLQQRGTRPAKVLHLLRRTGQPPRVR